MSVTLNFEPKSFTLPGLGIEVTETVIVTWGIMAVLIVGSYFSTRKLKDIPINEVPDRRRGVLELLVESIVSLVESTMGKDKRGFAPYMGTITLYIVLANTVGLIGLRPPTADLNTTFALSTLTFICIHYYSIKSKGLWDYLKGYLEPFVLFLPMNIIGEISTPFSMAFRLFGNMMGGTAIMALIYAALPIIFPILPHMYFDIFSGVIQTFIFVMLTMTFISGGID